MDDFVEGPYAYTWESRRLDGSITRHIVYADHYCNSPGDLAYVLKNHDYIALFKSPQAREPLTDADIYNACLSYRHDFGLMPDDERKALVFRAKEWARAFGIKGGA